MANHHCVITLEENAVAGGAGSAVSECLAAHGLQRAVHHIGIPDRFIEHGSREDCLAMAGLDAAGIARQVERLWPAQPAIRAAAGGRPGAA
jgi:1-deoxy-D-xylulose-5-phosphate synthase